MAVTLPAAVGVIGPNWEYKSRALNETFHKSAPVLQAVQQRIQINTLGGGGMLRLVCNVRVSQTYIDSVWFVQVSGFQVAESGDGEE